MPKPDETPLNVDIPTDVSRLLAGAKERWGINYKLLVAWAITDMLAGMDLSRVMAAQGRYEEWLRSASGAASTPKEPASNQDRDRQEYEAMIDREMKRVRKRDTQRESRRRGRDKRAG